MWSDLLYRLRSLLRRRGVERELRDELQFHIQKQAEKYESQGLSHAAAIRKARLDFGGIEGITEECREARGGRVVDELLADLRYGIRALRRAPVLTAAVCLILGLGIGVNMTFFELLNATTFRPLAVKDPATLVRFWRRSPVSTSDGVPYPATQFVRDRNDVLSAVLLRVQMDVSWGDAGAGSVAASFVSLNWFEELGYGAAYGRVFSDSAHTEMGGIPTVVLSHQFWVNRLGSERDVIGDVVRINGVPAIVAGIAPKEFPSLEFEAIPQIWLPIHRIDYFNPGSGFKTAWLDNNTEMYGRLRPGVSLAAAKDGLRLSLQELARQRPDAFREGEWLEPLSGTVRFQSPQELREMWQAALLVAVLALVVFSISCANVCSLVLSRFIGRLRELGIRAALGAGRWRLIRGLLAEGALLSGIGAVGGVLLGYWAARLTAAFQDFPLQTFALDWRTLLVALAFAFPAALAAGFLPGYLVTRRSSLTLVMKDGSQQSSAGLQKSRFNQGLVAIQFAGSCVMLVIAALITSNLERLHSGPGFAVDDIAVLAAAPSRLGTQGAAAQSYWHGIKASLTSHPEVDGVALVSQAPLSNVSTSEYPELRGLMISVLRVEPEFFALMGIRIILGRTFDASDAPEEVVMISRRLATRMYGSLDVIGQRYPRMQPARTIIGVVEDARIRYPANDGAEQYTPLTAAYFETPPGSRSREPALLARARTDAALLLAPMREAARQADSRVLARPWLLQSDLNARLEPHRITGVVASLVSLLALLLACLGVFGLVSYGANIRTKELGIRMALGADRRSLLLGLLTRLAHPAFWGVLVGLAGAFFVSKALEGEPLYLSGVDLRAYGAALLILSVAAITAAWIPAMRVLRSDPLKSLRQE